jgi:hypothetical protein
MTEGATAQQRTPFLAEVSRIVPGLYGWLATVCAPVLPASASWLSRFLALLALASLVGAYVLSRRKARLSRLLGVHAFVACCFLTWLSLGSALRGEQLDPVRGALGALGFLLHALAWGAPQREPEAELPDNLVPGLPLQPRHRPGRGAGLALSLGIVLALLPSALAFAAPRTAGSLLAHTVALGCGLLVVGASSDLSLRMGKAQKFAGWRVRATRAVWPLSGLVLAGGVALLWLALH